MTGPSFGGSGTPHRTRAVLGGAGRGLLEISGGCSENTGRQFGLGISHIK